MRKLIYIVGCANCGSTLLTALLGRHPSVATVGELKATAIRDVDSYICGCGSRFLDCEFWKSVRGKCSKAGMELDLRNFKTHFRADGWLADRVIRAGVRSSAFECVRSSMLSAHPGIETAYNGILNRNRIIIDAICETLEKPVFLDSSKDPVRALHLSNSRMFDMKIIHLVRDGRAIVASYKKRDANTERNLVLWKSKALECERVKLLLPKAEVLTLRYEDMCTNLQKTMASIRAFVGLPDVNESQNQAEPPPQHILGHNSRLGGNKEVRLREEWRSLLTEDELKMFRSQEDDLNRMYGYADSDIAAGAGGQTKVNNAGDRSVSV